LRFTESGPLITDLLGEQSKLTIEVLEEVFDCCCNWLFQSLRSRHIPVRKGGKSNRMLDYLIIKTVLVDIDLCVF